MDNRVSRRTVLLAAGAACAGLAEAADEPGETIVKASAGGFPGLTFEKEGRWAGPFVFLQLADTQFGMFNADAGWEKETELFERAVAHINRLRPKFAIVCGDLVNQVTGPKHRAQVEEFQRIARRVDPAVPLVCVCGNHDVGNRPTASTLETYRREWGDDRFTFWAGGTASLVLNSSLYSDPADAPAEQAKQEAWLAAELERLRAAAPKHLFLFQHHSWFLERPDEPDQYFNIPRVRRDPALALLRRAAVRAVFAGHYHRNAYGRDGAMEMITTSAVGKPLGKDPSGFRIVRVFADRIDHRYFGMDQVPGEIGLDGDWGA